MRRLNQETAQPGIAFPGLATQAFSCALVIARTGPCPRGELSTDGKSDHIQLNLSQDPLCHSFVDPNNGNEEEQTRLARLFGQR